MALEERGNGVYYYRKRREGDRVVSEYGGTGRVAQMRAQIEAADREQERLQRARDAAEQARYEADDRDVAELLKAIRIVTGATLVTNGYYRHKRQWRRRYGHLDGYPATGAGSGSDSEAI